MTPETTEPRGRGIARISRIVLLSGMVLGLGLWAAGWMRDSLLYVHETDARIAADMVSVSSRVAGRVPCATATCCSTAGASPTTSAAPWRSPAPSGNSPNRLRARAIVFQSAYASV